MIETVTGNKFKSVNSLKQDLSLCGCEDHLLNKRQVLHRKEQMRRDDPQVGD